MNPTFAHFSFFFETQPSLDPLSLSQSALHTSTLNNLHAPDYSIQDFLIDNDVCISRKASEYPSGETKNQHINLNNAHPMHYVRHIQKGIWYYDGLPESDHLDLCGFPMHVSGLRRLMGIEYRQEIWRRIFARVKMLDI